MQIRNSVDKRFAWLFMRCCSANTRKLMAHLWVFNFHNAPSDSHKTKSQRMEMGEHWTHRLGHSFSRTHLICALYCIVFYCIAVWVYVGFVCTCVLSLKLDEIVSFRVCGMHAFVCGLCNRSTWRKHSTQSYNKIDEIQWLWLSIQQHWEDSVLIEISVQVYTPSCLE